MLGKLRLLRNRFTKQLQTHPILVNSALCGTFGLAGDGICQVLERKLFNQSKSEQLHVTPYSLRRSFELGITATMWGPFVYYWYRWLDKRYPGRSFRQISRKVLIDLSLAIIWYPCFLGTFQLVKNTNPDPQKRRSLPQLKADLIEKIPVLLCFDMALWPVFQGINFYVLPPMYRVVGTKCSELTFDVILSYVANNDITLAWLLYKISGGAISGFDHMSYTDIKSIDKTDADKEGKNE